MTFTQRIFYLLEVQGKKKAELAKYLGVRPTTVTEWDTKNKNPSAEYISRISEFLEVSCDYLLTGKEKDNAVSNSNIGAIGSNSNGAITINNASVVSSKNEDTICTFDATTLQVAEVFKTLNFDDKLKVMNLISELKNNKGTSSH